MLTSILTGLILLGLAVLFFEVVYQLRDVDVTVTERVS